MEFNQFNASLVNERKKNTKTSHIVVFFFFFFFFFLTQLLKSWALTGLIHSYGCKMMCSFSVDSLKPAWILHTFVFFDRNHSFLTFYSLTPFELWVRNEQFSHLILKRIHQMFENLLGFSVCSPARGSNSCALCLRCSLSRLVLSSWVLMQGLDL